VGGELGAVGGASVGGVVNRHRGGGRVSEMMCARVVAIRLRGRLTKERINEYHHVVARTDSCAGIYKGNESSRPVVVAGYGAITDWTRYRCDFRDGLRGTE